MVIRGMFYYCYTNITNYCLWLIAITCAYLHTMIAPGWSFFCRCASKHSTGNFLLKSSSATIAPSAMISSVWHKTIAAGAFPFSKSSKITWLPVHEPAGHTKWSRRPLENDMIKKTASEKRINMSKSSILVITHVRHVPCKSILCTWYLS